MTARNPDLEQLATVTLYRNVETGEYCSFVDLADRCDITDEREKTVYASLHSAASIISAELHKRVTVEVPAIVLPAGGES